MSEMITIFDSNGDLTEEAYKWFHDMDRKELDNALKRLFFSGYNEYVRRQLSEAIDKAILEGSLVKNEL